MVESTISLIEEKREQRFTEMRKNANYLAARIREYWTKQGYQGIEVEVIYQDGLDGRGPLYSIVTNIGASGWPPKGKSPDKQPERIAELIKLYTR
jgi:hypothetical protein